MKEFLSDFRIYKRECGFLFIVSMLYNAAYIIVSTQVHHASALRSFLVALSVLLCLGWYKICLCVWQISRRVQWQEGLKIIAFHLFCLFAVSFGLHSLLVRFSSSHRIVDVLQVMSGIVFVLFPFFQMTYFYHVAMNQKLRWNVRILRGGIVLMSILVLVDTLLHGVFSLQLVNGWQLLSHLMYEGNPWFNWIVIVMMNLMYQASGAMMLFSIVVYFFVGLFYAILEINFVAGVARVMDPWK